MTERAHTAGPLVAHHQPYDVQSGDGLNDSIQREDGEVIALICLMNSGNRADVRLWAAAPAMYEALEALIKAARQPVHYIDAAIALQQAADDAEAALQSAKAAQP